MDLVVSIQGRKIGDIPSTILSVFVMEATGAEKFDQTAPRELCEIVFLVPLKYRRKSDQEHYASTLSRRHS